MERKTSLFLLSAGLLCHCHISAVVPPATNVSLDCHNFQNTLRWDYSQHASLKPQFIVNVKALNGKSEPLLVNYPDLQCDLSSFSRPDNDYLVTVTALVGLNESLPAPPHGLTYSYYHRSPTDQKCSLDLPSVNVTIQSEAGLKFSFSHPSVVYGQKLVTKPKRRQRKPDHTQAKKLSAFVYTVVVTSDNKTQYGFSCLTDECEGTIPAGLQQESDLPCVNITGSWESIVVQSPRDYCAQAVSAPPIPPITTTVGYQSLLIGLGVFFLVAVLGLVFAFCFKTVTSSSPAPFALSFNQAARDCHRDFSHTPLIPDHPSVSPQSPPAFAPGDPFTASAVDQEAVRHAGSTITVAEKEPERPLPTGAPAVPNGSVPLAPGMDPAAEARGAGAHAFSHRAGDDPGAAACDAGPGHPVAEGVEEDAPEAEPLGEAPSASGYEQRETVRVEFTPGEMVDAYQCSTNPRSNDAFT